MKTKQIVAALVLIVIVIAAAVFISMNSSEPDNDAASQTTTTEEASNEEVSSDETSQYPNLDGANFGKEINAEGQEQVTININDNIYEETIVTISAGTTVTWVNNGQMRHDIATDNESEIRGVKSQLLGTGESFSHTFEQTGKFTYFCSPHPIEMRGVVVVK